MDKKKLRNDIFLIASLLLVALIALICVMLSQTKKASIAKVYVQDQLVYTIDLSKKEEKDYPVHGLNGDLTIHTHDGAICVSHSNCPHQDCVKTGYVNTANKPIICAYNAVYIIVSGNANSDYDLEI